MYIRPSPVPATKEELEAFAEERKFQRAVDLRLPLGAENRMKDPALAPRRRPVYACPECPECKRTVRHYGRCTIRKTFDLKPTKTWEREP